MSGTQDQTPMLAVQCSNCGRENAAGRLFCQFCGYRIVARPQEEPDLKGEPTPSEETQPLQASLQAAQDENQNLHQQLASMQEELNKVKAALSSKPEPSPGVVAEFHTRLKSAENRAATLESQSAEWEKKWKSAEEKAASFEEQMVTKAKEVQAAFQRNSETKPRPNHRLKLIAGMLFMVGSLGGYGAGRRYAPPNGRFNQLLAQLRNAQEQISNLKSSQDSAGKNANQVENDLRSQLDSAKEQLSDLTNTSTGQQHLIEKKLASTQRDLASTENQLNAAITREHSNEALITQTQAELAASNQHIQQLEAEIQSRNNEISALRGRMTNLTTPPTPQVGFLIWSGTVVGKRKIEIKNGVADYGSVSGALPRTPCTLTTPDPTHVQFKTLPAPKNQWNRVVFEVSGTGAVQVRINWVSSQ